MKYFAVKPLTVGMLPKTGLLDFMDFGTPVHCKGCSEPVWGWIKTETPITPGLATHMGLVPAL
jgi:hypothetical protein